LERVMDNEKMPTHQQALTREAIVMIVVLILIAAPLAYRWWMG
jgi:hypothetical protein